MLRYYDTDLNEIYNEGGGDKPNSCSNLIVYRTIVFIVFTTSIYYYAIHLIYNL